jgi:twitching motility protein PilJ
MAFLRLPTKTPPVTKKAAAPAPQAPRAVPKAIPKALVKPMTPGPTTVAEGPKRRLIGMGSIRVGQQYTILGVVFAVLFVAAAVVVFKDNREAAYGTVYVATSGQMRMLTQRLAKAA